MDEAPSPCVGLCQMQPDGSLCKGCFRTLDEISQWRDLDQAARQAILSILPQRKQDQTKNCFRYKNIYSVLIWRKG